MSRSGYHNETEDYWQWICWRGAVKKAINGKRGQAALKIMLEALDALPEKKLIKNELITPAGEVCAIGSMAPCYGINLVDIDPEDNEKLAEIFNIAECLVQEIEFINDEFRSWSIMEATPEARYEYVRAWVVSHIKSEAA